MRLTFGSFKGSSDGGESGSPSGVTFPHIGSPAAAKGLVPSSGETFARADTSLRYDAMHGGTVNFGSLDLGIVTLGLDKKAGFEVLEGKTPAQIALISSSCWEHYGRDLAADLGNEFSGADGERVARLIKGDQRATDLVAIRIELTPWPCGKAGGMVRILGSSAQQARGLAAEYEATHGSSLMSGCRATLA